MLGRLLMLGVLVVLGVLAVPRLLVARGFLLVATSSGGGFLVMRNGTAGTHPGIARRARPHCRWLTAARG
jgi:hypothetical protein